MAFSENTFTYLGGAQVFDTNFALGVLEASHVVVTVDGNVDGFGDPIEYNHTYNFATGEVTVLDALTINDVVRVKRNTPIDMLVVDFDQDADVTRRNLTRSLQQSLMSVQENADSREADSILLEQTVEDITTLVSTIDAQVASVAANTAIAVASKNAAELAETNAEAAEALAAGYAASINPTLFSQKSANLSDLANAATARTNLGLGTAATQATGAFATAAQGGKADTAYQAADLASQAEAEAGVSNTKLMTPLRSKQSFTVLNVLPFTGPVATTSGASVDLSLAVPPGVRRITVILRGVSTNGAGELRIRVGNGVFVVTGYASTAWGNNTSIATAADAFTLTANATAPSVFNGEVRLTHVGSNNWVCSSNLSASGGSVSVATGQVTLAGALDRVQLHLSTGNFDLGEASMIWEF